MNRSDAKPIELTITEASYIEGALDLPLNDGSHQVLLPTGELVEAVVVDRRTPSLALFVWNRLGPSQPIIFVPGTHTRPHRLVFAPIRAPASDLPARKRRPEDPPDARDLVWRAGRLLLQRFDGSVHFEILWGFLAYRGVELPPDEIAHLVEQSFFLTDDGVVVEDPPEEPVHAGWQSAETAYWELTGSVPEPLIDRGLARDDPSPFDSIRWHLDEIGHRLLSAEEETELGKTIKLGQEARKELKTGPDPERRKDLGFLIRRMDLAKETFVARNLRLVFSIAKSRAWVLPQSTLEIGDLVQSGYLGLLRAVEKFDPTRGTKFSTYATWWIRQSIDRAIADTARTIRVPVHALDKVRTIERARGLLELGTSDRSVEAEAGLSREEIQHLDSIPQTTPLPENLNLPDRYADYPESDPQEIVTAHADRAEILEVLEVLKDRDREILLLRNGFHGERMTLEQVGKKYNLTRERIRQLEKKALKKTKKLLLDRRQSFVTPAVSTRSSGLTPSHKAAWEKVRERARIVELTEKSE